MLRLSASVPPEVKITWLGSAPTPGDLAGGPARSPPAPPGRTGGALEGFPNVCSVRYGQHGLQHLRAHRGGGGVVEVDGAGGHAGKIGAPYMLCTPMLHDVVDSRWSPRYRTARRSGRGSGSRSARSGSRPANTGPARWGRSPPPPWRHRTGWRSTYGRQLPLELRADVHHEGRLDRVFPIGEGVEDLVRTVRDPAARRTVRARPDSRRRGPAPRQSGDPG